MKRVALIIIAGIILFITVVFYTGKTQPILEAINDDVGEARTILTSKEASAASVEGTNSVIAPIRAERNIEEPFSNQYFSDAITRLKSWERENVEFLINPDKSGRSVLMYLPNLDDSIIQGLLELPGAPPPNSNEFQRFLRHAGLDKTNKKHRIVRVDVDAEDPGKDSGGVLYIDGKSAVKKDPFTGDVTIESDSIQGSTGNESGSDRGGIPKRYEHLYRTEFEQDSTEVSHED